MLPYPEWRKHVGLPELAALKDAGFDFVRIPVDPSPFLSDKTARADRRSYASVLESARLANRAGLKADRRHASDPARRRQPDRHGEGHRRSGAVRGLSSTSCARMAKTLSQEDPALVAFELMNEPVIDCEDDGADRWPDAAEAPVCRRAASATRLTLVLTGACMSNAEMLVGRRSARLPGRQPDLDLPLLPAVSADPPGRDLGRRLHPLRHRPSLSALRRAARRTRCRARRRSRPGSATKRRGAAQRHDLLSRRADRRDRHAGRTGCGGREALHRPSPTGPHGMA